MNADFMLISVTLCSILHVVTYITVYVCRLPVDETLTFNGATYAGKPDDFITLSLLGEGVRGTVYKCRHRPSNCKLAVKVSQQCHAYY